MHSMLKSPLLTRAYPVIHIDLPITLSSIGIMDLLDALDKVEDVFVRGFSFSHAEQFRRFAERIERVNKEAT